MGFRSSLSKSNSYFSQSLKSSVFMTLLTFIFKLFHIFFALDFGFIRFNSPRTRIIVKILMILQSVVFSCIFLFRVSINIDNTAHYWMVYYLINYVIYVIILALFKEHTSLFDLLNDFQIIDLKISHNISYNIEFKIILSTLAVVVFRLVTNIVFCLTNETCEESFWKIFFNFVLFFCLDIVLMTYIFVFYSIFCRFNKFKVILKTASSYFESYQLLYKSIIDITEKYKAAYDPVFITGLLFSVPEVMATIYLSLGDIEHIKLQGVPMHLFSRYMIIIPFLILNFTPALYAGKLSAEAENIKVILHEKFLLTKDVVKVRELDRFIRYVEARPCRLRVFKVIPLDADLLGMVLSFCVTYLIVIIQFTQPHS